MLDDETMNNPFIRKSLETFNISKYPRFPVMFASIKNESEKIRRLNQIKDSINRDAINKLCEPYWSEKTRLRLSMTEFERGSEDGSITTFTKSDPSSIIPLPMDTLHRINLIFEIERSVQIKKGGKVSENCKIRNQTIISCVNGITDQLTKSINNTENETCYAFNTFPHINPKKHLDIHFNAVVLQFYEHLRNDILTQGDEFRNPSALAARNELKELEQELFDIEESEGIKTHQGILPLWDFMLVDMYINRLKKLQEEQKIKICDACGLLYYSSSKSEQAKHYCGVHIGGHSGAEIKQFVRNKNRTS